MEMISLGRELNNSSRWAKSEPGLLGFCLVFVLAGFGLRRLASAELLTVPGRRNRPILKHSPGFDHLHSGFALL